jgi:hypothetical protein
MDLAGIQNGGIIGFKYFGFGGLAQDTKGCKAFEGTKKGDNTYIYLNLTYGKHGAFKIHVRLDNPWKGKEIALIDVLENSSIVGAGVPDVEGLTGKHAIYLVVDGPEVKAPEQPQGRPQWGGRRGPQESQRPQGLFDLHGIGFSKGGDFTLPAIVPEVRIYVDGQKLNIPGKPIMSTNQNGYTECNRYQLYAPLKAGSKVQAEASVRDVKFEISPVVEGRAMVKATYQGQVKYFLVN